MSFSESIDLNVTAKSSAAAEDLRDVGKAAKDAHDEVEKLDQADVDIAIDDAQLPSVKEALEEIRDQADKLDAEEVTVDVSVPGADAAAGSLNRVHGAGDKSRSVLANMVGNSAQDLGALGGIAGSTGVAIGQLAEYSAEGDIKLSKLATTGGAMIGVGLVLNAVMNDFAKEAKAAAEIDAFEAKKVEAYTEAVRAGKTAIEAMNEELTKTEELMVSFAPDLPDEFPDGLRGVSRLTDALPAMREAGVDLEKYNELVGKSTSELTRWASETRAAGVSNESVRLILAAVKQEKERLAETTEKTTDREFFFGKEVREATLALYEQEGAVKNLIAAYQQLAQTAAGAVPPESTPRSMRGEGGPTIINYQQPAVHPERVQLAQQEWVRVQEGPVP